MTLFSTESFQGKVVCGVGLGRASESILQAAPLFERHLPIEPLSFGDSWHPEFIRTGPVSNASDTLDKTTQARLRVAASHTRRGKAFGDQQKEKIGLTSLLFNPWIRKANW